MNPGAPVGIRFGYAGKLSELEDRLRDLRNALRARFGYEVPVEDAGKSLGQMGSDRWLITVPTSDEGGVTIILRKLGFEPKRHF